jgi:hypothetical protein
MLASYWRGREDKGSGFDASPHPTLSALRRRWQAWLLDDEVILTIKIERNHRDERNNKRT